MKKVKFYLLGTILTTLLILSSADTAFSYTCLFQNHAVLSHYSMNNDEEDDNQESDSEKSEESQSDTEKSGKEELKLDKLFPSGHSHYLVVIHNPCSFGEGKFLTSEGWMKKTTPPPKGV